MLHVPPLLRHIGLLVLSVGCVTAPNAMAVEPGVKPNILWIFVDDMSPNMSCYGETTIRTPHIDALAAEGVKFDRTFVTAPVCSPCRSALITGMFQTTIGAHNHRSSRGPVKIELPKNVKPLPVLFQEAGYYTVLGTPMKLKPNPDNPKNLGKSDYNFVWSDAMYDSNDWKGRKPGQPFFAQWQLHGGKSRGVKVDNPVDPAKVTLPPYYPDDPVLREDWADYLNTVIHTDNQVGEVLQRLKDEGLADNTVVFFMTDHGISHVRDKQFLYDSGTWVPFIVRWPKHLPAGTVRKDLVSHIDMAATSLELAGIPIPPSMEARPLFGPQAKPREYVISARDRCDETIDRIRSVRDDRYKYIRNYYPDRSHAQPNAYKDHKKIMVQMRKLHAEKKLTPDQDRVFNPTRPKEELYDLQADPYELHNLAAASDQQQVLAKMRTRLDDWIRTSGDKGQVPESAAALHSEEPKYFPPEK